MPVPVQFRYVTVARSVQSPSTVPAVRARVEAPAGKSALAVGSARHAVASCAVLAVLGMRLDGTHA